MATDDVAGRTQAINSAKQFLKAVFQFKTTAYDGIPRPSKRLETHTSTALEGHRINVERTLREGKVAQGFKMRRMSLVLFVLAGMVSHASAQGLRQPLSVQPIGFDYHSGEAYEGATTSFDDPSQADVTGVETPNHETKILSTSCWQRHGCSDWTCVGSGCRCRSACRCEPWIVSREPLRGCEHLSCLTKLGNLEHGCFKMPITGGAWHWFHQSLIGRSGGYGIPGLRDTYFWYVYVDPELALNSRRKVGGHLELRLRETDTFRTFVDQQVWPWEAYGYIQDEDWGTLKAGLLYKQFGLFWDGVFFGNAPYFDGAKLDADYGISWESTREVNDCLKIDRYFQFFFHEDQSNGSFGGGDAESVAGYTERNTGVVRIVPTWTRSDGVTIAFGLSGLLGQINSTRRDLQDETVSAYAVDLTYTRGPWKTFVEGAQTFGVINPVRYVSGGPSNRITNILTGVHYTHGPATYRCSYSNSIDANPAATQNMFVTGATVTVTKNVDFYLEWVYERVDNADIPGQQGFFFNGLEYVINWHF